MTKATSEHSVVGFAPWKVSCGNAKGLTEVSPLCLDRSVGRKHWCPFHQSRLTVFDELLLVFAVADLMDFSSRSAARETAAV